MSVLSPNHWVIKTVHDDDRAYRSIDAYDDDLTTRYSYDSNVPNHLQLSEGDYVVIIDKERILGYAKVDSIKEGIGEKRIDKCPVCGHSNIESRKTKTPRFRCNAGHEFELPNTVTISVRTYTAYFGFSFIPFEGHKPVAFVKPYILNYNRNNSIQKLDPRFLNEVFPKILSTLDIQYDINSSYVEESFVDWNKSFGVTDSDEREVVLRQIKARKGQPSFRNRLLDAYGKQCMVTECGIVEILEAAHIKPYRGERDNNFQNGLLLRSDIHTLFDLNLIGIQPDNYSIHLNERINTAGYEVFAGRKLLINETCRPNSVVMDMRWQLFQKAD